LLLGRHRGGVDVDGCRKEFEVHEILSINRAIISFLDVCGKLKISENCHVMLLQRSLHYYLGRYFRAGYSKVVSYQQQCKCVYGFV